MKMTPYWLSMVSFQGIDELKYFEQKLHVR